MAVVLRKYNDSFGFIDTDDYSLVMDAWDNFSFFSEGYRFNPKFKNSNWDGKIRLINLATRQFPLGLTKKLYDYLSSYTEDCTMESNLVSAFCEKDIKEEDIKTYFSNFKFYRKGTGEIFPRDDQLYAVSRAIMMKRCTNICPTSFGKSLSIFMEYLWYRQFGMKTIIVVPSVDLCYQFENDIAEYCTDLNGKLAPWFPKIQRIHGSQSKKVEKDTGIVISTWQSLASIKKEIPDIMSKFDVFVLDECFSGESLVKVPDGYKQIKDIKVGDQIINYSEKNKKFKIDTVVETFTNLKKSENEKFFELEFDNGKIIQVTGNHKFLTSNRGWIRADELTEEDDIVSLPDDYIFFSTFKNAGITQFLDGAHNFNSLLKAYGQKSRIVSKINDCITFNSGIKMNKKDYDLVVGKVKFNSEIWKIRFDEWICNKDLEKELKYINKRESKLGSKNGMFGIHHSDEYKKASSLYMKNKIKSGEFTPKSCNRLSHHELKFNNITYRSSWEYLFHHIYPHYEYEKLRIEYKNKNNITRIYIVDFIDYVNKIVVEIKPSKFLNTDENTKRKIKYLRKWCSENNFICRIIDESDIEKLVKQVDVCSLPDTIAKKLKGFLK